MIQLFSFNERILSVISVVFVTILLRILPHPPNIAPMSALFLLGGMYSRSKRALVIPVITLIGSDIVIGLYGGMMIFTYGCYFLTFLLGRMFQNGKVGKVITGSLISSIIFFIITNYGVWAVTDMYEPSWRGLLLSYSSALPFFRNSLFGDLLYSTLGYVCYRMYVKISQKVKNYRTIKETTF